MKTQKHQANKLTKIALPFAAVALIASSSQAAVINVDIQGTLGPSNMDYTGANANGAIASDNTWSYFTSSATNGSSMTVSGTTFTFGTGWTNTYGDGAPNNLQGDRAYTQDGNTGFFTISGLDTTKSYNLALIGASNVSAFESSNLKFVTDFTIDGTTKTLTTANAGSSANGGLTFTENGTHVLFNGLDASTGSITFSLKQGTTAGAESGVLAGLQLEAVAVPEPSTTALLGLGGLALILRRRR